MPSRRPRESASWERPHSERRAGPGGTPRTPAPWALEYILFIYGIPMLCSMSRCIAYRPLLYPAVHSIPLYICILLYFSYPAVHLLRCIPLYMPATALYPAVCCVPPSPPYPPFETRVKGGARGSLCFSAGNAHVSTLYNTHIRRSPRITINDCIA